MKEKLYGFVRKVDDTLAKAAGKVGDLYEGVSGSDRSKLEKTLHKVSLVSSVGMAGYLVYTYGPQLISSFAAASVPANSLKNDKESYTSPQEEEDMYTCHQQSPIKGRMSRLSYAGVSAYLVSCARHDGITGFRPLMGLTAVPSVLATYLNVTRKEKK